jgi:hypothetical protein
MIEFQPPRRDGPLTSVKTWLPLLQTIILAAGSTFGCAFVVFVVGAMPGHAGVITTIDFEHNPGLPPQPTTFVAAGPMQTYTSPGVFTITGGVVLGNATGLSGLAIGGSVPNAYGTSDLGDLSLQDVITLTFPASEAITNVTGVLFNGQLLTETYSITALSGAIPLAGQTLSNIPAASSTSDFRMFSISSTAALPITTVRFNSPADVNLNGWDFFVDTITISAVPEPSSVILALGGLATLGYRAWRRCSNSHRQTGGSQV